jgi:RNA polymerase sigma-70 factor (ECF subfamily)
VQELFIALWEKRETLLIGNLSVYLNTAVRNRVISRIRTKLREEKHWNYYYSFFPTTYDDTEQSVLFGDLNKTINDILLKLPSKTRQVFKANWVDGKSMAEVSSQLNISEKNAEYHLTKSLKSIRGHLKKHLISIAFMIYLF